MGPAIIGVSEVENITVMQDLARDEQLKAWNLQVLHHDSPDRRGIDVGFLFNPRLFRPLNVTHHTLVVESNPNFRTRDQSCVSGLLLGEPVSVIVNHWPSRLGGQKQSSYLREAAAALSKHIADSVLAINPKQKIIIMGDLNDDPMDPSCAEVLGAKRNVKDVEEARLVQPLVGCSCQRRRHPRLPRTVEPLRPDNHQLQPCRQGPVDAQILQVQGSQRHSRHPHRGSATAPAIRSARLPAAFISTATATTSPHRYS